MEDKEIKCVDCPDYFTFTVKDQEFYARQGFNPPKRCAKCRVTKKARFNDKPIKEEKRPLDEWQKDLQDYNIPERGERYE